MALNWINIRSGERLVAETEPQIAALWASSDHSPNITQGQDFGWRLSPEVVVEMKKIKQDLGTLEAIARRFGKMVEDVNEIDILHWISNKTALAVAPRPDLNQFEDDYNDAIRKLEGKDPVSMQPSQQLSTEELEAELARRKAANPPSKPDKK